MNVGRGSTEEQLTAQKAEWRKGQSWQFRRYGESQWRWCAPLFEPGWFFDTEYRRVK